MVNDMELLVRIFDIVIEYGNLVEGVFWIILGLCFLVAMLRPGNKLTKAIACSNFILFGLSDFVEIHTGAWWKPWWLLYW